MKIEKHCSLKPYNTFGIDVEATELVILQSQEDYAQLFGSQYLKGKNYFVLGGGSNVVFTRDFDGVVVRSEGGSVRLLEHRDGHYFVEADAGVLWDDFVRHCVANEWFGVENMVSIPGTVGASPVQNVGAYGVEVKDVIESVHLFDIETGEERTMRNADCGFGYRWSVFKGALKGCCLVDRVVFRLDEHYTPKLNYQALRNVLNERGMDNPTAQQVCDVVAEVRASKLPDPKVIGSAGSFFKNPVVPAAEAERLKAEYPELVSFPVDQQHTKLSAGWMIEKAGWKGRDRGQVGVYEKQALVLVNRGGCTGDEVRQMADAIIADIMARFGVRLEPEAIML